MEKSLGTFCLFCDRLHLLLGHGPGITLTGHISANSKELISLTCQGNSSYMGERGMWELEILGECGITSGIQSPYQTGLS